MKKELESLDYTQLERRRQEVLSELADLEDERDRRRKQGRLIMKASEVKWLSQGSFGESVVKKTPYKMARLVSPELGFEVYNLISLLYEMPSGSKEGADHVHGEAIKYYLGGKGQEIIEGKVVDVQAGDTMFIPAYKWHTTVNTGTEPLRFFAVAMAPGVPMSMPVYRRVREETSSITIIHSREVRP